DETLRYGVMMNMIDTAWADGVLDPQESKALELAQAELNISNEQRQAIANFVQKMREIRTRGLDDTQAADAIKTATAGLSAVGVPIAAVYLSGSVIGLSAAGITSGLAAIGLGFGMVPGIGIAVLVGAGIFMGVSQLLD
ncbi:MAG: TerB family tellurite resistance protein, partial [Pseudanabaena sp.]